MINNYILNQEIFNKAVEEYRKELPNTRPKELFKWELVEHFQKNWNIDSDNFPEMVEKTLKKAQPLLGGGQYFPIRMIIEFARKEPETVKQMFMTLFESHEKMDLLQRCKFFEKKAKEIILKNYPAKTMHCQDARAISTYLWLHDPAKYHAYKFSICTDIAKYLFNTDMPSNKYERFFLCSFLYELLNKQLSGQKLLIEESQKYNAEYSRTEYFTDDTQSILTVDLAFFISEAILKKGKKINQDIILNGDMAVEEGEEPREYSLNQILYGPPGTGKTYSTVEKAVEICAPNFFKDIENLEEDEKRFELKKKYDDLVANQQISFVTFHQSFSYEDFVEGIRAKTENGQIEYDVEDGIFKEVCQLASVKENKNLTEGIQDLKDREVWKMSLGDTLNDSESSIYDECLENNYVLLGYGYALDYSNCNSMKEVEQKVLEEVPSSTKNDFVITAVNRLKNSMKIGDLIVVTDGNRKFRAIAEITGDYFLLTNEERNSYRQARPVKWLRVFESSIPVSAISTVNFSQMSIYQFYTHKLKLDQLLEYIQPTVQNNDKSKNYVLIIDEINRGNIANIFGELITLLEPSKRAGNDDARSVVLPYSKEQFSVPNNLYVIGTMNTSDHSLTKLDLALRRRFEFVELLPDYELLNDIEVHNVNIGEILETMNERIEILLGRDYLIGHSYFLELQDLAEDKQQEKLASIFQNKIIPLLQEYFFEDWERIQWVLNDQNKEQAYQFIHLLSETRKNDLSRLFGNVQNMNQVPDRRYQINEDAFKKAEAYLQILTE